MTTMTTVPTMQSLDLSPIAGSRLDPAPREEAPRQVTAAKPAPRVSFDWQLEADGVQDAIERIYR
jgi:hypothetical protein